MKDAYYFPHDSNSKNDPKIIKLLQKHDWYGYGLYWALIEMLRENEKYELQKEYDVYAYALRTDSKIIKSVIEDFDLFKIDGEKFYSQSLKNRMEKFDKKKEQARKAAMKRWEKKAQKMRPHSERNASIVYKSIVDNNKNPSSIQYTLADYLYKKILKNNPRFKKPNLGTWAGHIEKMIRIDNRPPDEIKKVIDWCQKDTCWWSSNILSTNKLRIKYDQLLMKSGILKKRSRLTGAAMKTAERCSRIELD